MPLETNKALSDRITLYNMKIDWENNIYSIYRLSKGEMTMKPCTIFSIVPMLQPNHEQRAIVATSIFIRLRP